MEKPKNLETDVQMSTPADLENGAAVEIPPAEPKESGGPAPLHSDDPTHPGYDPPTYEADPNTSIPEPEPQSLTISPAQAIEVYVTDSSLS